MKKCEKNNQNKQKCKKQNNIKKKDYKKLIKKLSNAFKSMEEVLLKHAD